MPEITIDCDPKALLEASKCYCFPNPNLQAGAMIYLMNVISGLNLTPEQILENSKCFCFSDKNVQQAAMIYLTCAAANAAAA